MVWYKILSLNPDDEDSHDFTIQIRGDEESIGPDVCAWVKAQGRRHASELLKTAIYELRSWEIHGIKVPVSDERIHTLAVVAHISKFSFVETIEIDVGLGYLFISDTNGKKNGPTLEAVIRADGPDEALAILVTELASHSVSNEEASVIPIEVVGEASVRLTMHLDCKNLRAWPRSDD